VKMGCVPSRKLQDESQPLMNAAGSFRMNARELITRVEATLRDVPDGKRTPADFLRLVRNDDGGIVFEEVRQTATGGNSREAQEERSGAIGRAAAGAVAAGAFIGSIVAIATFAPLTPLAYVTMTLFGVGAAGGVATFTEGVIKLFRPSHLSTTAWLQLVGEGRAEVEKSFLAFCSYKQSAAAGAAHSFKAMYDSLRDRDDVLLTGPLFIDADSVQNLSRLTDYVQRSRVFIVFLTKSYFASPYCLTELLEAVRARMPIVTIVPKGLASTDEWDTDPGSLVKCMESARESRSHVPLTYNHSTRQDWMALFHDITNVRFIEYDLNANEHVRRAAVLRIKEHVEARAIKARRQSLSNFVKNRRERDLLREMLQGELHRFGADQRDLASFVFLKAGIRKTREDRD